jgi:hypothetical protein
MKKIFFKIKKRASLQKKFKKTSSRSALKKQFFCFVLVITQKQAIQENIIIIFC